MREELTDETCAELNRRFYDAEPWSYFDHRLVHLMLVASDVERYRAICAEGVTLGKVDLKFEPLPSAGDRVPTVEQSHTAVQTEVLLHHSAETLLRLLHAHAEPSRCPWLRMSEMTSFRQFKDWVGALVAPVREDELRELSARVFACDQSAPDDVRAIASYLRLFARHFLESDSYNAAKHGLALRGAAARRALTVDGYELLNRDGATLTWLARWPRNDPQRPGRWTEASRLLSVEAAVALIHVAGSLMRALWWRARHDVLGEDLTEVFKPVPPHELFAHFELHDPVIADFFRVLESEEHPASFVIRSKHMKLPDDALGDDPKSTTP